MKIVHNYALSGQNRPEMHKDRRKAMKTGPTPDNGVYVKCECHDCTQARFYETVGSIGFALIRSQPIRQLSSPQPSITTAPPPNTALSPAILGEDETKNY